MTTVRAFIGTAAAEAGKSHTTSDFINDHSYI